MVKVVRFFSLLTLLSINPVLAGKVNAQHCIGSSNVCVAANPSICCPGSKLVIDSANCPVATGVVGGMPARCVPETCVEDHERCVAVNPTVCCPGTTLKRNAECAKRVPPGAVGGMPAVCGACVDNSEICVAANPTVCCPGYQLVRDPKACPVMPGALGGKPARCVPAQSY